MRVLYLVFLNDRRREGLFAAVTSRITSMSKRLDSFDVLVLSYRDTWAVKTIKVLIKGSGYTAEAPDRFEQDGIVYNYVYLKNNIIRILLRKTFGLDFVKPYVKMIEARTDVESYDLMHVHWAQPNAYIAGLLKQKYSIPYIVTSHGSDIHTDPGKSRAQRNRLAKSLDKADCNIFISEFLRQSAVELGYSGKNSKIIGNGIELAQFDLSASSPVSSSKANNLKTVGFIGSLNETKRVDKFPEIFDHISRDYGNGVRFVVVGEGYLKPFLARFTDSRNHGGHGNIVLAGSVDHGKIADVIRGFDVLILPSRLEGFGLVILEANACGVPVVGSSNGAIPEVLGSGGIVVEDGRNFEKRFARAVVRLLQNPMDGRKLKARVQKYSWDSVVDEELGIYREVAGRRSGGHG